MTDAVPPSHPRHPELVSGSIADTTPPKGRESQIARQVPPLRVAFLNQVDLPLPPPRLDPLFARDGGVHGTEQLEMDEKGDAVAAGETFEGAIPMLSDTRHKIGRDAGVERFAIAAGHDVGAGFDVALHRLCCGGRWTLKQVQGDD